MIRRYEASDRSTVTEMLDEFYHSPAVLHPIPRAHFEKTLNAAEAGNPCVRLYVIESGGRPAGYALPPRVSRQRFGKRVFRFFGKRVCLCRAVSS